MSRVPSFHLLVPGPWNSVDEIVSALRRAGVPTRPTDREPIAAGEVRVDRVSEAAGFGRAMQHGRFGELPRDVVAAAARCQHAALLECGFRFQDGVPTLLAIGRALRDAGGVAIRVETSGGASPWASWFRGLEVGGPMGLVHLATIVVGDQAEGAFTCGMHAFDLPEAEVDLDDMDECIEWLDVLAAFQIAERPVLGTGHTFRPDAERERHKLERWPDDRHEPGDGRYNSFGVWRLLPDDEDALPARDPVTVFMPSLLAILIAAERSAGRSLDRDEVVATRDAATCMAVALVDAIALERSRGYADLEPERVWEQWQRVRAVYR